ncbi:MAG: precorrin-6A/cobalt-precorrin-6A reductase [Anaerolineae bacterium]|nr:precorrin-6A/cobalt-precorrin-6A reductase [Anaerolineae bacterium]
MDILIIGGTRNMGHLLVHALRQAGHVVTVLNRGKTRDELPKEIERLRADRTEPEQLKAVLANRHFDAVVDTTLYNAEEARVVAELLRDRTGHYIFLSSGQVYLIREGLKRPFKESDYAGRLMPAPKPDTFAHAEWRYGLTKREAEDALQQAWQANGFPVTTLRLPMVNSERDHFFRLYNYVLRLRDGGPVLAPSTPNYPLRHVYGGDVINAIVRIAETGLGKGRAYNISQDETVSLDEFLDMVGEIMDVKPRIVRLPRATLEAHGFLPDCSPFSERWMSELDNSLSKAELGITYTPLKTYLGNIVRHYLEHMPPKPPGYRRRKAEIMLLQFENEPLTEK